MGGWVGWVIVYGARKGSGMKEMRGEEKGAGQSGADFS